MKKFTIIYKRNTSGDPKLKYGSIAVIHNATQLFTDEKKLSDDLDFQYKFSRYRAYIYSRLIEIYNGKFIIDG